MARYGWDYFTFMDQPEQIVQEQASVIDGEAEGQRLAQERDSGTRGGRPLQELSALEEAKASGLLLPVDFERMSGGRPGGL